MKDAQKFGDLVVMPALRVILFPEIHAQGDALIFAPTVSEGDSGCRVEFQDGWAFVTDVTGTRTRMSLQYHQSDFVDILAGWVREAMRKAPSDDPRSVCLAWEAQQGDLAVVQ